MLGLRASVLVSLASFATSWQVPHETTLSHEQAAVTQITNSPLNVFCSFHLPPFAHAIFPAWNLLLPS